MFQKPDKQTKPNKPDTGSQRAQDGQEAEVLTEGNLKNHKYVEIICSVQKPKGPLEISQDSGKSSQKAVQRGQSEISRLRFHPKKERMNRLNPSQQEEEITKIIAEANDTEKKNQQSHWFFGKANKMSDFCQTQRQKESSQLLKSGMHTWMSGWLRECPMCVS